VPATLALDLLLGTQGWRTLAEKGSRELAGKEEAEPGHDSIVAHGEIAAPPVMSDNILRIRDSYDQSLADYRSEHTRTLNTLTTVTFLGGLGLLLLVAMLGLMRVVWGMHLWIPAIGATTCCLIIGAILSDPGRQPPSSGLAVPFQSYPVATSQPLQSKTHATNRPTGQRPATDTPAAAVPGNAAKPPPPSYAHMHLAHPPGASSDLNDVLFWNPMLMTGADGKASLHFDLSDAATTFRVRVDAQGKGRIGAGQAGIPVHTSLRPQTKRLSEGSPSLEAKKNDAEKPRSDPPSQTSAR
jgi:hypothetical protein